MSLSVIGRAKYPDQQFTAQISWVMMMQAFLARGVRISRSENTVSIAFDTQLEAQEFHKLLNRGKPDGR